MPDRSEEDTLEAELGLDDGDVGESDATGTSGSSDGVDLDALEAELGLDDGPSDTGDVGLDRDPSEQYGDLLDDVPGDQNESSSPDARRDDGGGLLSGLFGRGSDESATGRAADSAATDAPGSDVAGPGAAEDALQGDDLVGGLDEPASDTGAATAAGAASASGDATAADGVRARLGALFSPRAFLVAALAFAVLAGVGRTFVPLVGGPAGVAVAGFVLGLAGLRYRELAVAGVVVGAVGAFAGGVSVAFATGATERLLAIGAVGGLLLSLVGAYFGADLRAGLVGGDEDWSDDEP